MDTMGMAELRREGGRGKNTRAPFGHCSMRKGRTDGPGPVTRPTVNMTEIVFDRCANKEIRGGY